MRRFRHAAGFSVAAILTCLAPLQAHSQTRTPAEPVHVPAGPDVPFSTQGFDQAPFREPATFDLIPHSPKSPRGKVWVRSTPSGLAIWGHVAVEENSLHWPSTRADLLASNHVEVWLASATDVPMPPIGFGNQFGPEEFKSAEDCKGDRSSGQEYTGSEIQTCSHWFEQQQQYRVELKRLFVRQWLVSDTEEHSFEDFAATAYSNLEKSFFEKDLPHELAPKNPDGFRSDIRLTTRMETMHDAAGTPYQSSDATGYDFRILIPLSAFPPASQLTLRNVSLMVDVFNAAEPDHKMGAFSSTSLHRDWGEPASFNRLELESPSSVQLTPCGYDLSEQDVYGNPYQAWYFPQASRKQPAPIGTTFALMNSANGYEYTPGSMSPQVRTFKHFGKQLADGVTVCGPNLAVHTSKFDSKSGNLIDGDNLEARRLTDGWLLLRSGPTMTIQNPDFGSGMCGACDVEMIQIYAVSPTGQITEALDLNDRLAGSQDDPDTVDFAYSKDWLRVTEYLSFPAGESGTPKTHAKSITYCLQEHKYEKCAESSNVKMPSPPHFPVPQNPE